VEIRHGENVPLNGDHTHFIMIDDGSRYRFLGGSTDFALLDNPELIGLHYVQKCKNALVQAPRCNKILIFAFV
jgi:hypothetical protein